MSEISLSLNGQIIQVPDNASLQSMLESQQIALDSVALVRAGEVVPKSQWALTLCEAGDVIELFGVVAGG
ncbi:sulfur carrier protein ThiS [Shewanella alkalitolerans]|uniref:sulfur carrier protein ThiS n=1 Tax=Shewanella alkalitolerans TaxID=2864209 RepID=UPI001C65C3BD|nr:sulfur carrier protein ThiS [Shewanella alkalitolerans]QYJ96045.1 sulfur carrier protein ThiS [Shewanella alkalitolerans]